MHKLDNRVVGLKAVDVEIVSQASDGTWISFGASLQV